MRALNIILLLFMLVHLAETSELCNFENMNECSWFFTNSNDLNKILKTQRASSAISIPSGTHYTSSQNVEVAGDNFDGSKDSNFYVVVSGGANISNHYAYFMAKKKTKNVAMIVSSFYETANSKCELILRHRILGENSAELLITTEQLTLFAINAPSNMFRLGSAINNVNNAEDDDWIRPTLRAKFLPELNNNEPWITSQVPIGTFSYPTRIRIECHATEEDTLDSDINVECHIDDLQLVNCEEELYQTENCADSKSNNSSNRKYLCKSDVGKEICLRYEDLCDMHVECAQGEDESEELYKCSQVPNGARCNFEDLSVPTGCEGWMFFSRNSNTSVSSKEFIVRLISSDQNSALYNLHQEVNLHNRKEHLPPSEYNYLGKFYRPGHFLFFSSYNYATSNKHEIAYSSATSPFFPPLVANTLPPCMLRFFYCKIGSNPFQIFLINKINPHEPRPIWAPPKDEVIVNPCEWKKATVVIRPHLDVATNSEYFLKFSFAKIAGSLGSIAIDDVSLTSSCFSNYFTKISQLLPVVFNAGSCDRSGSESPDEAICVSDIVLHDKNNKTFTEIKSNIVDDALITYSSNSHWIVPKTANYRVELYGGAGGFIVSQKTNNNGGIIIANVKLKTGSKLEVIVGQRGESPCDPEQMLKQKMTLKMRLTREFVCSTSSKFTQVEELGFNVSSFLFGSGGGGSTILFIDSQPMILAGGGGGTFPVDLFKIVLPIYRTEGGHIVETLSSSDKVLINSTKRIALNEDQNAGKGASFGHNWSMCSHCHSTTNKNVVNEKIIKGGICLDGQVWNFSGGFGGGGAACGLGGGGGAGYTGGRFGKFSHGGGGSSAFLFENGKFVHKMGVNKGNGRVRILACLQEFCPLNATCRFKDPVIDELPEMFCLCNESGDIVPLNGTCYNYPSFSFLHLSMNHLFFVILLSNILIFIILILICCVGRAVVRSRNTKGRLRMRNYEMLGINVETSSSRCAGNKIIGNPIYETLQLSNLTRIARDSLQLNRIIGHGAFGEVYEGFYFYNEKNIKVAVKSLPIESCLEVNNDFETEARLLSRFKHSNIVAFYGISFEQQPKYIVLEYLEGGDLKNFLRESRPKFGQAGFPALLEEPLLRMVDLIGFAIDVAKGCEHLEATKFVHRDIAARNCLLTSKLPDQRTVKIADFGMARDIYRNDYYRKGGKAFLPVRWMPPEAFLDGIFTTKTDVWAFGVLLWEIFSMGYVPYSGRENQEVMKLVVAGDRLDPPVGILPEIYEIMLMCWNTDADKRPKFFNLVTIFSDLAKRKDVLLELLPPIRYRMISERLSATPSTMADNVAIGEVVELTTGDNFFPKQSTLDEIGNQSVQPLTNATLSSTTTSSQATTMTTFFTSGASGDAVLGTFYDSMPTTGDGVCRNVFPSYEPKISDPLMKMNSSTTASFFIRPQNLSNKNIYTISNNDDCKIKKESSFSSQEDSTFFESTKYQKNSAMSKQNVLPNCKHSVCTLAHVDSKVSKLMSPLLTPMWKKGFKKFGKEAHSLPDSPNINSIDENINYKFSPSSYDHINNPNKQNSFTTKQKYFNENDRQFSPFV